MSLIDYNQTIDFNGYTLHITVDRYNPGSLSNCSGDPDAWTEAMPMELEYTVDSIELPYTISWRYFMQMTASGMKNYQAIIDQGVGYRKAQFTDSEIMEINGKLIALMDNELKEN